MRNLKFITILLLLASMALSVVACTPAEESKAESNGEMSNETSSDVSKEESADVSERVSDDISEVSDAVSESEREDQSEASKDENSKYVPEVSEDEIVDIAAILDDLTELKLRLQFQNEKGEYEYFTYDRFKGDKELHFVDFIVLYKSDVAKLYKEKYGDDISDLRDRGYVYNDPELLEIVDKMHALIDETTDQIGKDLMKKYNISADEIYLEEKLLYRYGFGITAYEFEDVDISHHRVRGVVYLDKETKTKLKNDGYDVISLYEADRGLYGAPVLMKEKDYFIMLYGLVVAG